MSKSTKETKIADLYSVSYNQEEDRVFVTFEVTSDEYKELVFRLARRDDVNWIIRGDSLSLEVE